MFFDVNFRISFLLVLWRISLKTWGDNNTYVHWFGRIAIFRILLLLFQSRSMEGLSFIKVSCGMLDLIYCDYSQDLFLRLLWMGHTFFSDFFPSKFVGVAIHYNVLNYNYNYSINVLKLLIFTGWLYNLIYTESSN